MVDTSFTPEDHLKLNDEAERTGSLLIPDSGYAPGLTNLLAGRISASFNEVEELCGTQINWEVDGWMENREINMVMLVASLLPN